jgi:NAD dependent epimerase/dehydratase family enzyme
MPVPKFVLKARFGGELGEVLAGGQRVIPRRALDAGFEFAHPELEPALRNLLQR